MWLSFLVSILVLLIVIFVWRFVAHLWAAPKESASPPDEANVFARIKPRPRCGAGAVALEEPEDDEPNQPGEVDERYGLLAEVIARPL